MLKIEHLTKTYASGKRAVDDVSLHVFPGDVYGFIGHNGAGKTTTIKCVTGILNFDAGDIWIDGKSVREQPLDCKRVTAYIPDNPDVYEHLSGLKYLNFIADVYRVAPADREARIAQYSEQFELKRFLGDPISSYSHGMKQKLVIISALVHQPRLLVLDEPFVGLDPKAAFTVKQLLAELCRAGSAVFFSTHVLEVAEKICNKIAIIKDGRILIAGETDQVRGEESLEQLFLELTDHA